MSLSWDVFKSGDILNVVTQITPFIRSDQYQVMLISDYTSILCMKVHYSTELSELRMQYRAEIKDKQ